MKYHIKLQDTNRQSFTIDQVKLNHGLWRGSEQFKKYGKLMKIVDYKPLDFKEVKWEPVDGISTQKARSSGANESKEELEELSVEGWDEFSGKSPHRPWIDKVKIKHPDTGLVGTRIPDV